MKIGITGTRSGMSPEQKIQFIKLIDKLKPTSFIDGCCIGVDEETYLIVKEMGIQTIGRPGYSALTQENINEFRSVYQRDIMHMAQTHFARNRDIVKESDIMIAIPYELNGKGGTNYTIDYSIKMKKPLYIILRNGEIITHNV
jgi:hypothetical protein